MEGAIIAHAVSLGFKNGAIVSDVSLQINQGEFIGIFGANGSGKTTFLRALLGLMKPLAGTIRVMNTKPKRGNPAIGYMPQLRSSERLINFTSRAILAASMQCTCYGLPLLSKASKQEIQTMLELVEAQGFADRPFHGLSGGERQRIYLAQALLGRPAILLLDEPLAGLDPHYQDIFISLLATIKKKLNSTILFTAHDPNPLLHVLDRVMYFANKKVAIGPVNEIITSETLSLLYETPIDVIHYKNRIIVLGERTGAEAHHD